MLSIQGCGWLNWFNCLPPGHTHSHCSPLKYKEHVCAHRHTQAHTQQTCMSKQTCMHVHTYGPAHPQQALTQKQTHVHACKLARMCKHTHTYTNNCTIAYTAQLHMRTRHKQCTSFQKAKSVPWPSTKTTPQTVKWWWRVEPCNAAPSVRNSAAL